MNARERFQAAADLFLEAGKLAPGQVDEFLRARCGSDSDLRIQVQALLDGRNVPDIFDGLASRLKPIGEELRGQVPGDEQTGDRSERRAGLSHHDPDEAPGRTIGRFRLVELLGEGGFGRVWVAEQTEPVRRQVAIKILKAGMDSREVLARFEAERQALAFMDHPNIAKVLDAGMTERGRPYFVMEHVPGTSISAFCDASRMRVRQRLELFVPVCRALHHAHQRGIIHRDLKPSNILVTLVDGRPAPKIIDFGIAKATTASLTERSLVTVAGRLLGTPEYMSPEQAASAGADIDTRSDIYSLGVVLYQLLTGTLPFDTKLLLASGYEGMIKVIREQDPPKPSTRFSTLMIESGSHRSGTSTDVARNQGTEARTVQRELRGELDWLVMKCLEKDRERRYESADALGADIQRYLDGRPIIAAPPSRMYQVNKLVRRNGMVIGAASSVVLALLLGLGFSLYRYALERDARQRAEAAETESQTRADNLQKVADFQAQMLGQVDPTIAGIRLSEDVRARFETALVKAEVPEDQRAEQARAFAGQWGRVNATDAARELIDRTILRPAVEAIEKQFADQPAVAASLRDALAERYHQLGMYDTAVLLERQALEVRRRVLGGDHPETLASIGNMGSFLQAQGKRNEAEPYYREVLERSRRVFGEDDSRTLSRVANMGYILNALGKRDEAEPFYRDVLEMRRRVLGDDHPDTLLSINNMGLLRRDQGRLPEAELLYTEALEKRRRVLGEEHRDTLSSLSNLAALLREQGKTEEAARYFREVLEKRRRVLGETHPTTLATIRNLGTVLAARGEFREAETLMREALSNQQRLLGADHPDTIGTLSNLAVFLIDHGDVSKAELMCREALERRQRVLGHNHPDTLISNNVMGYVLRRQSKLAEAEPYIRETLAIGQRVQGPSHPDTLLYKHNLAAVLLDMSKAAEAESLFREVIRDGTHALGEGHTLVLSATSFLGSVLVEQKRLAEAVELLSAAEVTARKSLKGESQRSFGMILMNLGKARSGSGQFDSAESNLLEAHAIFVKVRGPAHKDTRAGAQALADFYSAWDAAEPSVGHHAKVLDWGEKLKALNSLGSESSPASVK